MSLDELQTVMWDKCCYWLRMVYVTVEPDEEQESKCGTSVGLPWATEVQGQRVTQRMFFT